MTEHKEEEEKLSRLLKNALGRVQVSTDFKQSLLSKLTQEGQQINKSRRQKFWVRSLVWAPVASVTFAILVFFIVMSILGQSPNGTEPPVSETEPSTPPLTASTGTLKILVTDTPPEYEVTEINVILSNVQVNMNDETEDDNGWVMVVEGESSFNLIELRDSSVAALLGESLLDTGLYSQIRMDVEVVDAVVDDESIDVEVKLPSDKFKIIYAFEIMEDQTTLFTIDFDATESLVFTGSDKVIFQPVVKPIVAYE